VSDFVGIYHVMLAPANINAFSAVSLLITVTYLSLSFEHIFVISIVYLIITLRSV